MEGSFINSLVTIVLIALVGFVVIDIVVNISQDSVPESNVPKYAFNSQALHKIIGSDCEPLSDERKFYYESSELDRAQNGPFPCIADQTIAYTLSIYTPYLNKNWIFASSNFDQKYLSSVDPKNNPVNVFSRGVVVSYPHCHPCKAGCCPSHIHNDPATLVGYFVTVKNIEVCACKNEQCVSTIDENVVVRNYC